MLNVVHACNIGCYQCNCCSGFDEMLCLCIMHAQSSLYIDCNNFSFILIVGSIQLDLYPMNSWINNNLRKIHQGLFSSRIFHLDTWVGDFFFFFFFSRRDMNTSKMNYIIVSIISESLNIKYYFHIFIFIFIIAKYLPL